MSETEEEKKTRWAKAAQLSYMTPLMMHQLTMSKQQSQNKYKFDYDKNKGKGFTQVSSTPFLKNVKKQSVLVSQNAYKSDFEKNKAKFTPVADDPNTIHAKKVSNQISNIAYTGKGAAVSKAYTRKPRDLDAIDKKINETRERLEKIKTNKSQATTKEDTSKEIASELPRPPVIYSDLEVEELYDDVSKEDETVITEEIEEVDQTEEEAGRETSDHEVEQPYTENDIVEEISLEENIKEEKEETQGQEEDFSEEVVPQTNENEPVSVDVEEQGVTENSLDDFYANLG